MATIASIVIHPMERHSRQNATKEGCPSAGGGIKGRSISNAIIMATHGEEYAPHASAIARSLLF
jgi:hypothetical protein